MPSVTSCAYDRTTLSASVNELDNGVYTIGFIVTTDGAMGPQAVANGALSSSPNALPALWSTYSYQGDTDLLSYARNYEVTCDPKSVKLYYIKVTYSPPEPGEAPISATGLTNGAPINSVANPMAREPVYWWDREVYTHFYDKDVTGKVIQNFAAGLYHREVELEKTRAVLVVEFNVGTLGEVYNYSRNYDQAVNQTAWNLGGADIPPRCAVIREVSSSPPMSEHGYTFFRVMFRIAFADTGFNWDVPLAEMGEYFWVKDANGEYVTETPTVGVGSGHRVRESVGSYVPLEQDGTRRLDNLPMLVTNWRVRREADFNLLPF